MSARWVSSFIKKSCGLLLAVGGIAIIAKILPFYVWVFFLGIFLIFIGWHIYIHDRYYY